MNVFLPNIFGKSIKEIQADDVRAFCIKQVPEGSNLDYKRDLTSKTLVKTIASFGNTTGGWIILGADDKDDIPDKQKLHIRIASRAKGEDWERYATSDEWEWLRKKRQKSEKLRTSIKDNLEMYFSEWKTSLEEEEAERVKSPYSLIDTTNKITPGRETEGMLNVLISPLFPRDALLTVQNTYDTLEKIAVPDYYGTGGQFPIFLDRRRVVQDGTVIYGTLEGHKTWNNESRRYFTALNVSGKLISKETVLFELPFSRIIKRGYYIQFSRVISRLDEFLTISANLFDVLGYEGALHLEVFLHGHVWMEIQCHQNIDVSRRYQSPTDNFL